MAVNATAVISMMTKNPSGLPTSIVEISHQQSPFLSLFSICPPSTKLIGTATARCQKRAFVSNAKATKSESSLDPKLGVAVYKPRSYEVLVSDAATALYCALQDGKNRLEIDFPLGMATILLLQKHGVDKNSKSRGLGVG